MRLTGIVATGLPLMIACGAASADYVWFPAANVQPSTPQAGASFGHSASACNDFAIFGAPHHGGSPFPSAGAVYIAQRSGVNLSEPQELVLPLPAANRQFGYAVAISNNYAVIGAPSEQLQGENGTGAAFVFQFDGVSWSYMARLTPDEHSVVIPVGFGSAVAIDGDRVVVGVPSAILGFRGVAGAAYVFELSDGVWERSARLLADEPAQGQEFGRAVDIDGDEIVVGAPGTDFAGPGSGAAYIFYGAFGGWFQAARLTSPSPSAFDNFGWSVAKDGPLIAVGAPFDIENSFVDAGSVCIFTGHSFTTRRTASFAQDGSRFGFAVAISGTRIAVAGVGFGGSSPTVEVLSRVPSPSTVGWRREAVIGSPTWESDDPSATSVVLTGDLLLIGHPGVTIQSEVEAGVASLYFRDTDCNGNGNPDRADLESGTSQDLDADGLPDECADCDDNGVFDLLEIELGMAADCNQNQLPDFCELRDEQVPDCNANERPDSCDVASGDASDFNGNGILDSCECDGDIDGDGIVGLTDLTTLLSNFGRPSGSTLAQGDLNGDGAVNLTDLSFLLSQFGCAA